MTTADFTPTLAQRIAADIVATAEQYPAVRDVRSFSALHDCYDANESILAASELHFPGYHQTDAILDEQNEATDDVNAVLELGGFASLSAFAVGELKTVTLQVEVPVQFIAEVEVDVSDPDDPLALRIKRFVVMPWESFAGYFGKGAEVLDENVPEKVEEAAIGYWKACNDDTWPITKIDWEE